MSDNEIDRLLSKEEAELRKDQEINRILSSFTLDSYSILELTPGVPLTQIKKTYRKKSLLIHPDKTTNPRAPDAFDLLKKSEALLNDEESRKYLDDIYTDARKILIRDKNLDYNDSYLMGEEFKKLWNERIKDLLIEDEMRKRLEVKKKQDEELKEQEIRSQLDKERLVKKKLEKEWDDKTYERVNNWREYNKGVSKKKKKKKTSVLA